VSKPRERVDCDLSVVDDVIFYVLYLSSLSVLLWRTMNKKGYNK